MGGGHGDDLFAKYRKLEQYCRDVADDELQFLVKQMGQSLYRKEENMEMKADEPTSYYPRDRTRCVDRSELYNALTELVARIVSAQSSFDLNDLLVREHSKYCQGSRNQSLSPQEAQEAKIRLKGLISAFYDDGGGGIEEISKNWSEDEIAEVSKLALKEFKVLGRYLPEV